MNEAPPIGTSQGLFHLTETMPAYAGSYLHKWDSPVHTHSFVEIAFAVSGAATHHSQAGQREMITELVHSVADGAPDTLGPPLREAWADSGDDGARWRVVVDQVATLTDQQACDWHRRLVRKA